MGAAGNVSRPAKILGTCRWRERSVQRRGDSAWGPTCAALRAVSASSKCTNPNPRDWPCDRTCTVNVSQQPLGYGPSWLDTRLLHGLSKPPVWSPALTARECKLTVTLSNRMVARLTFPNGSNMALSWLSVKLSGNDPTYSCKQ